MAHIKTIPPGALSTDRALWKLARDVIRKRDGGGPVYRLDGIAAVPPSRCGNGGHLSGVYGLWPPISGTVHVGGDRDTTDSPLLDD